jgi:mRNA-degrading endonuclease RelE of RelBE toxin-antitoxin system
MKEKRYTRLFAKTIRKLNGRELENVLKKIDEIAGSDIDRYKNLSHDLKRYKRVHVNRSFVIIFEGDDEQVTFVDYAHHDVVYER